MPSRDYVWCLVCSMVRGGVGISACRPVLCRAVPCRAAMGGGGGKEALCHGTPNALFGFCVNYFFAFSTDLPQRHGMSYGLQVMLRRKAQRKQDKVLTFTHVYHKRRERSVQSHPTVHAITLHCSVLVFGSLSLVTPASHFWVRFYLRSPISVDHTHICGEIVSYCVYTMHSKTGRAQQCQKNIKICVTVANGCKKTASHLIFTTCFTQ